MGVLLDVAFAGNHGTRLSGPLPLNQGVTVEFIPKKDATFGFACGMNMLKGVLVVQ